VNLLLIFLILKKVFYGPVKKLLADREASLSQQYAAAKQAQADAMAYRSDWEEKLRGADAEADAILREATDIAKYRAAQIVEEATEKAEGITSRAEADAILTKKKAEDGIKREIVDVSAAIAEKMLEREVDAKDHRTLIDSFIDRIGEGNDE
jgi:F-type H+-transporting ATPase subunit b